MPIEKTLKIKALLDYLLCRITATSSEFLKNHGVSTESQQNLQNDIFENEIIVVIRRRQLECKMVLLNLT